MAQPAPEQVALQLKQLQQAQENLDHRLDELAKAIDDVAWFQRVGDVAVVDKWRIAGPPAANPVNPTAPGAVNPVKFYVYTFVPRDRKPGEKLPMLILPHGGVHADFTTYHAHIIRELMAQGYVVVAPDYRGSTGYGRDFYELIDYGGREVDDIHASAEWALAELRLRRPQPRRSRRLEPRRAHRPDGGVRAPQGLRVRLRRGPGLRPRPAHGVRGQELRGLFSAKYHIGKTVREDIGEYKRRSPVWNVDKLAVPLLIHTNTNDEDVNVIEVEHLIQALKAAGKKFEYKVYQDAPGGHSFDRMDTPLARQARARGVRVPRPLPDPPATAPVATGGPRVATWNGRDERGAGARRSAC